VWSSGDGALGERQMTESGLFCDNGFTYLRLESFGHWIPLEAPSELSRALIDFLADAPSV